MCTHVYPYKAKSLHLRVPARAFLMFLSLMKTVRDSTCVCDVDQRWGNRLKQRETEENSRQFTSDSRKYREHVFSEKLASITTAAVSRRTDRTQEQQEKKCQRRGECVRKMHTLYRCSAGPRGASGLRWNLRMQTVCLRPFIHKNSNNNRLHPLVYDVHCCSTTLVLPCLGVVEEVPGINV